MVERFEVEFVAGTGAPQTKIVRVVCVVAWHWCIIGLSHNDLAVDPIGSLDAVLKILFNMSVESDWVYNVRALDLPRVA